MDERSSGTITGGHATARWRALAKQVAVRLLLFPVLLLFLISAVFALVNLIPSDPARLIAGENATSAEITQINHELGLDQSVPARYLEYLKGLPRGDFQTSYYSHKPVAREIGSRLASTVELVVLSLLVGSVYGIGIGALAAYHGRRWPDRVIRILISTSQSMPDFLLGVLLVFVFFTLVRIAPAPVGQLGFSDVPDRPLTGAAFVDAVLAGNSGTAVSAASHLVLPVLTLAAVVSTFLAKTARGVLIQALASPYSEFGRSCGLTEWRVVLNALAAVRGPIITYIGILFAALMGGESLIEYLFAWNGLGQWALNAILQLDVPAIEGYVLLIGSITLVTYLVLETVNLALDPRLLVSRGGR